MRLTRTGEARTNRTDPTVVPSAEPRSKVVGRFVRWFEVCAVFSEVLGSPCGGVVAGRGDARVSGKPLTSWAAKDVAPQSITGSLPRRLEAWHGGAEPGQAARQKALPQAHSVSGMFEHRGMYGEGRLGCREECSARIIGDLICV
jgi:hypothetical protein